MLHTYAYPKLDAITATPGHGGPYPIRERPVEYLLEDHPHAGQLKQQGSKISQH